MLPRRDVRCSIFNSRDLPQREYVPGGGLIRYCSDFAEGYRNGGLCVGKILKVQDPPSRQRQVKFDLVINLSTAPALGINAEMAPHDLKQR